MNKETRISFRIEPIEKERIEAVIKRDYPKIKTVSAVVRKALEEFLAK